MTGMIAAEQLAARLPQSPADPYPHVALAPALAAGVIRQARPGVTVADAQAPGGEDLRQDVRRVIRLAPRVHRVARITEQGQPPLPGLPLDHPPVPGVSGHALFPGAHAHTVTEG